MQTDDELRSEVRAWLAENWNGTVKVPPVWDRDPVYSAWLRKVYEARWAVPRWPAAYGGRDLDDAQARIVEREFAQAGAPGSGQDRTHLAANTLLRHGTPELKADLLPRLLCKEALICLLYSEPGAGSDLAGVRTRAERRGDAWVINGQKVWTSGAMHADYGLLLARSDWDVPKHRGLSFFFLPMKQAGIDVRPLRQITGESHFNEVFIDGALAPAINLLGEAGDGWKVLQTALAYERAIMADGAASRSRSAADDDLIAFAREAGRLHDPVLRQDIARVTALRQLNALNTVRAKADLAQGNSSSLMSLGKLAMSRILHEDARVRTRILGAQSLLDGPEHGAAANAGFRTLNAYMTSIGGGTDQIQRNIIGERVLGLPKEPELDRDQPFRSVRTS